MKIFDWIKAQNNEEKALSGIDREAISRAYTRREKEIESLREYDRGNKVIDAPNLKTPV